MSGTGNIIDGKALAKKVRAEVRDGVAAFREAHGRAPGLTVVLVGEDQASQVYVGKKEKDARRVGIDGNTMRMPASTTSEELRHTLESLNTDDTVDGILLQLPLPDHIDADEMLSLISPDKDVDGFHPISQGKLLIGRETFIACTPKGMMRMIAELGLDLRGKRAVVVGRSNIVGKPIALLLLAQHATVTICHSRTTDLAEEVARADIVVAAVGRAEMVKGDWIKPGAVVLDVGINRTDEGKLVGDVDFAGASERASWITPVPGGVGPMTVASLLENTLEAARRRAAK